MARSLLGLGTHMCVSLYFHVAKPAHLVARGLHVCLHLLYLSPGSLCIPYRSPFPPCRACSQQQRRRWASVIWRSNGRWLPCWWPRYVCAQASSLSLPQSFLVSSVPVSPSLECILGLPTSLLVSFPVSHPVSHSPPTMLGGLFAGGMPKLRKTGGSPRGSSAPSGPALK
jgi:hypothetical protein